MSHFNHDNWYLYDTVSFVTDLIHIILSQILKLFH